MAGGSACLLLVGVDPQMISLTNATIIKSSYYIYTVSLLLHYLVLSVKDAEPPTIAAAIDDGVDLLNERVDTLRATGDKAP